MALDQDITTPAPRSRRAMLAGALGGLAGLVVGRLGSPDPASAAAGSPLIIGSEANNAGTSNTQLIANSNVVTFKLYQQGPGTALMGYATPSSGGTRGVYGRVDSPNGDGVQARNAGAAGTGAAVRAFGGNNDGVVATTDANKVAVSGTAAGSSDARGVYGRTSASSGVVYGVYGQSDSTSGRAVAGWAGAATGSTYGVYGLTYSTAGTGVYGSASASSGETVGVAGKSSSSNGFGVYGEGYVGVVGVATGGGAALYAIGDAIVGGTLTKSGGSFKIDHPLDPANKYLAHSFVESPDMMNVYNGLATLDDTGETAIELPDWFEALNRDCRYQLTPIGAPGPNLHVKTKVAATRFTIAGGPAGHDISWQVTGIRQDAWANENRIKVEEAKTGVAKGKYLHPELYGKPASKGVHPRPTMPD